MTTYTFETLPLDSQIQTLKRQERAALPKLPASSVVYISDKRRPGGSDEEIKSAYNLTVKNRDEDGFDIIGNEEDINAFIEDYCIHIED